MKNEIEAMITDITPTTSEAEDYTGEDGLLYCGKCHTPKEAYFAEGKTCFGRDRHPTDCDCQRAAREKQQAAESRQKHLEKVEDLKRRGFTDPAMRNWTFEHDNGRKERTHAKNEQETAAGMVFFPAASKSRNSHLRPYHIQRPLSGLYP